MVKMSTEECCDIETLKVSIEQAEKDVDVAERHLKNSQLKLKYLQQQLQDMIIADVGGLKTASEVKVQDESRGEEDEDTRRARVKRRWRILGMKIKFGLGAQALATKRRNIQDASSFIDRESEEASKEDQLDLEGKCHRKRTDKRFFRKGGVCVGTMQGRDNF